MNRLSEPDLHDHVPEIIDDLARTLEASGASEASGRDLGRNEAAKEHARQRRANGFSLAEALSEFSHFRSALLDLCTSVGVPLEGDVAELVHATIDQNMITGASEMESAELAEIEQRAALHERFVGILAHDLRNPLQTIQVAIEALIRGETTTHSQGRVLRRAAVAADRMSRMIHDLLDLTRARLGGGIPIERRSADLDAICRQVVDELSIAHPERTLVVDTEASARGEYDADRIAQVVSNLVANAIKYSPPDTPVRVTVGEDGGTALVRVHNHGSVIPAPAIPHLFEPFEQGSNARSSSGRDSLGLGLFIVQQIVEAHGGSIEVTSTPSNGTTFTVRVPRANDA